MSTPIHNWQDSYPRADKLGLRFVQMPQDQTPNQHQAPNEHPGYDAEDVEKALGGQFSGFQSWLVKDGSGHMFSCGHRVKMQKVGDLEKPVEVLCYYAADVEKFLAGGE